MAKAAKKKGRPKRGDSGHSKWLQVRIDDGLDELLDKAVADLHAQGIAANRSSVTRQLLRQQLSQGDAAATAAQTLREVGSVSERVVRRVFQDAARTVQDALRTAPERVSHYIERELQQST